MNVFGPKMKKVIQDWRKLHNEELHDMHYTLKVIPMR
jgi:hypothetical protein